MDNNIKEIRILILKHSYWEHFKFAKDVSHIYSPEHEKIIELQKTINQISEEIKQLSDENI